METIPISKFKASCLAVLKRVGETGRPVLVTKRGEPIARVLPATKERKQGRSSFGCMAETMGEIGDIVTPVDEPWEAAR